MRYASFLHKLYLEASLPVSQIVACWIRGATEYTLFWLARSTSHPCQAAAHLKAQLSGDQVIGRICRSNDKIL